MSWWCVCSQHQQKLTICAHWRTRRCKNLQASSFDGLYGRIFSELLYILLIFRSMDCVEWIIRKHWYHDWNPYRTLHQRDATGQQIQQSPTSWHVPTRSVSRIVQIHPIWVPVVTHLSRGQASVISWWFCDTNIIVDCISVVQLMLNYLNMFFCWFGISNVWPADHAF